MIVVDNASTDGSADRRRALVPGVRLLRQTTNLGFAGGVNAGAAAAHGDHLLLLNSDAEADAGRDRPVSAGSSTSGRTRAPSRDGW